MLRTQFISQVYWPDFLVQQQEKGFLIGWNMENFQCCITNFVVVPEESFSVLQETLQQIGKADLLWSCSKTESKPIVLGEWIPSLPDDYTPPLNYQREGIWLTLTGRRSGPLLHSLYSCGCLHRTSCHMIRYEAVLARQLHSFSISSLEGSSSTTKEGIFLPNETDLSYAIYQINNAENLGGFIWNHYPATDQTLQSEQDVIHPDVETNSVGNVAAFSSETDFLLSEQSVSSALIPSRRWTMAMLYCSHLWLSFLSIFQTLLETPLCSIFISIFSKLIPCFSSNIFLSAPRFIRSASLKDISITSAYICERSRLLWHCLYASIDFASKSSVSEVQSRRKQWIYLYSHLIFICIDILLGILFGLYLWHDRERLLLFFHEIGAYVQTKFLLGNLELLNNSPFGIKFNQRLTERLSSMLGKSIVALSSGYNYFIRDSYEEYLIYTISFMGCFGFTFQMLLVIDVIRSLTVHVSIIHMALSVLHYFQLKSLSTLFYLFQGKKKNYLRKRIDTLESNQYRLFFGTVYFTVLCFLFPTFAAYFFLFTMLQFCVVTLQAVLWICNIIVKEFPWCELYLFFCDPHVLSDSVHIDINYIRSSQKSKEVAQTSTSKIKSKRRAKKNLLRQTLMRENELMAVARKNSSSSNLEGSLGETKVKFADEVHSYLDNRADEFEQFSDRDISLQNSSHDSDFEPFERDENILSAELLHDHNSSTDTLEERNGEDNDETSILSTSSSSSEDIGWARHPEEDNDLIGDDSIFAMENIWGSSDDVDHEVLKDTNNGSHPKYSATTPSLSVNISNFNYFPPADKIDATLSPQVRRYSANSRNVGGAFTPVTSCTTYLSIRPSSQPFLHHLLKPYVPYIAYWYRKESLLRVLRGLIKGNPALDLQIIRAAMEISSSSLREYREESRDDTRSRQSPDSGRGRMSSFARTSSPPLSSYSALPSHDIDVTNMNEHENLNLYSEINTVARAPNVVDLWSLLLRTCRNIFSIDKPNDFDTISKPISIYGIHSSKFTEKQKSERFLFSFLIFTVSLCLLATVLGLFYAFSPIISSVIRRLFRYIIKAAIKHSNVTKVPQKGIFDIGNVHSFFSRTNS